MSPDTLTIDVIGAPAPQGSKRAFVVNGRAVMAESSKKVKPWRQDVAAAAETAAQHAGWQIPPDAIELTITFYMPRPGYHFGTGKNAARLKPSAPRWVSKKPDIDKLTRSTLDALTTSGVIKDDAQVARLVVEQRYADAATGARIVITPLISSPADAGSPARAAGEDSTQEVLPL
jgi:Holliday junction resolvase RusA-like endonuclease